MMVYQQLKIIFLNLIGIFRRAFCCFSRKRKPSFSDQLVSINVIPQTTEQGMNPHDGSMRPQTDRDWNSWDDSPRTVEEHIEQYRQQLGKPPTPKTEEPEPDYFSELEPVIKPQPKYYLGDKKNVKTDFSRLEAKIDVPITLNADLEDWEEDAGGWEELDTEQTKQLIREKRRELRNQRQRNAKNSDVDSPKHGLEATRISHSINSIQNT